MEILSPPEPAAHGKFVLVHLLLLLFPWRSYGPASAHATVDVLLFFLCWFQYLRRENGLAGKFSGSSLPSQGNAAQYPVNISQQHTWNEHNKLSSTLIIAPALSNSPQ